MIRNPTNGKYRNYFLGQYGGVTESTNADFVNAAMVNFSGPNSVDFIVTDSNTRRVLFSFLQMSQMYINADNFIIESKDLIAKTGNSTESFNFNNSSFYVKKIILRISGAFNQIPTSVMVANRILNNTPLYCTINIPSNLLNNSYTKVNPLSIEVDFFPANSTKVMYRINQGSWQTTQLNRTRGSSIVYRLVFDTSNSSLKENVTALTGQTIVGLRKTVEIRGIEVSYEIASQGLRIKDWKELR
ncbi:MAG: hypothetical protein ABDH21_06475 [bacterium]